MARMLKTRDGWNVDPDLHIRKAREAISRAEYARVEDAHKDIITALSYIAYLLDAGETKLAERP
jgi:hypothetical protein